MVSTRSTILSLLLLCLIPIVSARWSTASPRLVTDDNGPFNATEVATLIKYFLLNVNIQGSGGVVASPDTQTPGGSYYYSWARDTALTYRAILIIQQMANFDDSQVNMYLQGYVKWLLHTQTETDPNGVDVRVEAKFTLPDGLPYTGPWCRPQSDGPGLRLITLISYANWLIARGNMGYVKSYLWTGDSWHNGGVIRQELDWLVPNWQSNTCDLWEEVQSNDFFWNRFTMKHALFLASAFAKTMGDTSSAQTYLTTAQAINATIPAHFNGQYIFESTGRPLDAAVITALNNGYDDDGLFGPLDSRVAATITAFNTYFHSAYPINSADDRNGVPGILYGRYAGDSYGGGNPWVLTSAALAQLYYRGASEVLARSTKLSPAELAPWSELVGLPRSDLASLSALDVASAFVTAGDGVLERIRYHTLGADLHQPEQLDKNTGYESSATDLTWSYGNVLKAIAARNDASRAMARRSNTDV